MIYRQLGSMFLLAIIGLLTLLVMIADPMPVIAQGPPMGCSPYSLSFDFEDGSTAPWALFKLTLGPTASDPAPTMLGSHWLRGGSTFNRSEATIYSAGFHSYFGTDPLTTTYYVDYVRYKGSKTSNNAQFKSIIKWQGGGTEQSVFTATTAGVIYTFELTSSTYNSVDFVQVGTNVDGKYQSFDEIYISGCATGFPAGAGSSGQFCELVENADFTDDSNWTLYNSASITNSLLSLAGVDYAEQVITDTMADTDYTIELTATGTTTETDILQIELVGTGDLVTTTLNLTDTATPYSVTVTSGVTVTTPTPTLRLLMSAGSGDIDFICLSETDYFTGEEGACLTSIINGGEFSTAADAAEWTFVNGAVYNEAGQNAWLPYILSATIENNGVSAVGRTTLAGTPPEINDGEYLILQFDAKTLSDDGAITARALNDALTDTVVLTYTFSASPDYYTYQTDFSEFAGDASNIEVGFFNSSYVVTETSGIFLDNVCLFVSTSPITNPYLAEGYLTGFNLPNCATLTQWLSATLSVDLSGLETMETPSVWDPEDWVPWLASRLWVYAIKPLICFLLVLFDILGLSFLNWIFWGVRQPDIVLAWLAGWIGYFIADLAAWLLWYTSPLLAILNFLSSIFSEWQTMLTWLGAVVFWLWNALVAVTFWVIGYWLGQFLALVNVLLAAWNLLLPSISAVISEIVDLAVTIWNDLLVPWLESLGSVGQFIIFLIGQIGLLGSLIIFFFQTVWQFAVMIWSFLSGVADLPLTFYQAFDNSVSSEAFQLLSCTGDIDNYWCLALAGLVIVDEAISHSFLYPMVIIGIILATIMIFWRHIWELISFRIR